MSKDVHERFVGMFPIEGEAGPCGLTCEGFRTGATGPECVFRVERFRGLGEGREVVSQQEGAVPVPAGGDALVAACIVHYGVARLLFSGTGGRGLGSFVPIELVGRDPGQGALSHRIEAAFGGSAAARGIDPVRASGWEVELHGFQCALVVGPTRDEGDDTVGRLTLHFADGRRRSEAVVLVPFPDDQDPARVAAFRAAHVCCWQLVVDLVPADVLREVPLERWVDPDLFDDPDSLRASDFVRAWLRGPAAAALLDRAVLPVIPPRRAARARRAVALAAPMPPWLRGAMLVVLALALEPVADPLVHVFGSHVIARVALLTPLTMHWFMSATGHPKDTRGARFALGALSGLWVLGSVLLSVRGPVEYTIGVDAMGSLVCLVLLLRYWATEWARPH